MTSLPLHNSISTCRTESLVKGMWSPSGIDDIRHVPNFLENAWNNVKSLLNASHKEFDVAGNDSLMQVIYIPPSRWGCRDPHQIIPHNRFDVAYRETRVPATILTFDFVEKQWSGAVLRPLFLTTLKAQYVRSSSRIVSLSNLQVNRARNIDQDKLTECLAMATFTSGSRQICRRLQGKPPIADER